MSDKKFPYIRLTSQSIKGNYFGAYANSDENAEKGYTLFIAKSEDVNDYCECTGWSIRESCYHVKDAKKLEEFLGVSK